MNRLIRYLLRAIAAAAAIFVTTVVALWMLPTGTALAADVVTTDSNSLAQVKISPFLWTLLIGQAVNPLVGYLTGLRTSGVTKSALNLLIQFVQAMVGAAVMVGGDYVFTKETILAAIASYIAARVGYRAFLKPKGITSSAIDVNGVEVVGRLANVGVK